MRKILFTIYLFLFINFCSFSQKENNQWYFSLGAALDFTTNPPTPLSVSNMTAYSGSASIADASGNLLFYTNGNTIWNQSHSLMANGCCLNSIGNVAQNSLILKKPGSSTLYYVFTIDDYLSSLGFNYSIVDMSLASGQGSVTVKNASLFPSSCDSKLTATRHCNGIDYWVLIRENNAYTGNIAFRAYLLTAAGISTISINSTFTVSGANYGAGNSCMKLSPNGRKLASAMMGVSGGGTCPVFELFDFDSSTGVVSNHLPLLTPGAFGSGLFAYGVEFSPDGTNLFGTYNPGVNTIAQVLQWDLCAGSNSAIVASQTIVGIGTTTLNGNLLSMQLAPNGKIYIGTGTSTTNLNVINNPNIYGAACNYSSGAQSVSPKTSGRGLPNFCNSQLIPHPTPPPFTYTAGNSFGCQAAAFMAPSVNNMTTVACASTGYSVTGYLWNFGDPLSGAANTTGVANPTHAFSALGTYTTQLILYYSCGGGTDTLRQVVNINQSCITVNSTSITCANLGSATVSPAAGLGPYTYTWLPVSQTGSVATNLIPSTYTVVFHDAINNLTSSSQFTLNPLIPLAGTVANASSVSCYGAATGTGAVTNISSGSSQQYFSWFNGSSTFTSQTTNSLSAGLWTVTVTDALTACAFSNVLFITQPPAFNLTLSSNTPTNCAGTSIVLSGTNSGGTPFSSGPAYTYTWAAGAVSSTQAVSQASSGTYVYTLNSSDGNNCLTSNTIAVNFIANPVLTTSNTSVCPLTLGTLTVSGATNYTWTSPSTTLNLTGNTFTDTPLSPQLYTVVGEAAACTSTAVAFILWHNPPNAFATNNSPRCNGDILSMSAYGGQSYFWSGPNSFTSSVQSNSINSVSLNNAGLYQCTVTSAVGCTASVTQTVIVNPTPTVSVSGATVCTTQTLNLNASSLSGSTYLWSGPNNYTSTSQNLSFTNPLTNNTGTYTVKVTSVDGCTNTASTQGLVVAPPNLNVALSSNSMCAQALNGSPNTITLTANGANTYTLSTPYHISNSNPSGPGTSMGSLPPYNSGPATATITGSNGICTVTSSVTFSVIPNPSISVSNPTPVICAGQTFTYTNQGAFSYTWNATTPGFTTYTSGQVAVTNPSVNSVFSVYGGSLGCNSAIQTTSITVNPLPVFSISPGTPSICLNNKIVLTALGNADNYLWSPFTGLNSTSGTTVLASPNANQTYTAIGSLNSCTNSAFITVSVLSLPSPTATALKSELCVNDLITLVGEGGETYLWDGPSNLMYAGQTVSFTANSIAYAGVYTLTVADKNNCQAKNTTTIKINSLPSADLKISQREGCMPFSSNFEFYSPANNNNITAYWQLEDKTFYSKTFSYPFNTAKTYSIFAYYTDTITTCKNQDVFFVYVYPIPKADFIFEPLKPVEGLDEVNFINTSQGESLNKFNWYFINNQGYKSENKNTAYLFNDLGEYPVAMVVQNKWGCSDTIVKAIKVEPDFNFYVPNAFTPNEDNLNDVFKPVIRGVRLYEFRIFDRWGKQIFYTKDQQQGWDGYYNSEVCKMDSYVWKIVLSTNSGEEKIYTGQVLLNR